jgi:sarcosine oxidase
VVAAGAWSRQLLSGVGIDLRVRVTRETPVFFSLRVPPPIVVEWRDPPIYALPSPAFGLKAAEHHAGPETDPEESGAPSEASVVRVRAWVAERFPDAGSAPAHAETCLYTTTKDERFILERHGAIVVGSACSGHAFKFAPLVGERLADLVEAS